MSWKLVVGEELWNINCEILSVPLRMGFRVISTPQGEESFGEEWMLTNFFLSSFFFFFYFKLYYKNIIIQYGTGIKIDTQTSVNRTQRLYINSCQLISDKGNKNTLKGVEVFNQ